MLVFNCTKAASDFFTVSRRGQKQTPIEDKPTESIFDVGTALEPISQWLVHVIKVQRKNVIVAMHVHTRYAMVFCSVKKGDWLEFTNLLVERLFNNLHFFMEEFEWGDDDSFREMFNCFLAHHPRPYFCQRGDRSVQSHINDVAWQFEDRVYQVGTLPDNEFESASFDEWVNSLLRKTKVSKDYFYPDEEMFLQWVSHYGQLHDNELELVRPFFSSLRCQMIDTIQDEAKIAEIQAQMEMVAASMTNETSQEKATIPDNVVDLFAFKSDVKH